MAVYFIQAGKGGPVKIGFATNVKMRLSKMQSDNPAILTVAAAFVGTPDDERAVHALFSSHRLHGEWFAAEVLDGLARVTLTALDLRSKRQMPFVWVPGTPVTMKLVFQAGGGVTNLARLLGCRHVSLLDWKRVPATRAIAVSRATGIPLDALRPDVYLASAPTDEVAA